MGNKEMSGFTLFARDMRVKSINIYKLSTFISLNLILEYKTMNSIYFL